MYGFLLPDEKQTGHRTIMSREVLCGLSVLQACVPIGGRLSAKRLERRIYHAAVQLRKNGIRYVLTPSGFPWNDTLVRSGLSKVETMELYRAVAAPLALKVLELRGWIAERAVVVLAGRRVNTPLICAAEELAKHVSCLRIDVPNGGTELMEYLREEYGIPIVPETVRPALTVAFDEGWQGRGAALRLCGAEPELLGVEVYVPDLELPGNCDTQSLLAALWESGLVAQSRLHARVRRNDP